MTRLSPGMRRWAGVLAIAGYAITVGLVGGFGGDPGWGISPVWHIARDLAPTWVWAAMFSAAATLCTVAAWTARPRWWIIAGPAMLGVSLLLIGAWMWGRFVQGHPSAAFSVVNNLWFIASQILGVFNAHPFGRDDAGSR